MGSPPARPTTWSRPSARTPVSRARRSPGSAQGSTPKVGAFRDRSLAEEAFPYVFLDAPYCKVRVRGAITSVLLGASWQRCKVHFLRNVLAQIPKGNAPMVLAAIRTIFAQPDAACAPG